MVAESVSRYLSTRIPFHVRQSMIDAGRDSDQEHWSNLCEIGTSSLLFTPDEGGYGGTGSDIGALFEVLGRSLALEPFLSSLVAGKVLAGDQRHLKVFEGLVDGSVKCGVAYEEPHSFYDARPSETRAVRVGLGWEISGRKIAMPIGTSTDYVIVSAQCDTPGTPGVSLFLLPRDAVASALTSRSAIDGGMVSSLALSGLQVPPDAVVGEPGHGLTRLYRGLMFGTFAVCAEILGLLQEASELTLDYLKTRKQFGAAIGGSQVLQHRYVDILVKIEEARSAVTSAAAALDRADATAERAVCAAKACLTAIAVQVAEECIHMHGGIGLTRELPLAQMARRLVMTEHMFGDADYHLQRYVELGRRESEPLCLKD